MTESPRILCLDLALANTGAAVLRLDPAGDLLEHVETIHTEKTDKATMRKARMRVSDDEWRRTRELSDGLHRLLDSYRPSHVFIECPTGGSKSANAARSMAVARGAACAVLSSRGAPVTLVTPFEAKSAATGSKSASKEEVKQAVLSRFPKFDKWIRGKSGKVVASLNEHAYDAVSVYMAATQTKQYKELRNVTGKQQADRTAQ